MLQDPASPIASLTRRQPAGRFPANRSHLVTGAVIALMAAGSGLGSAEDHPVIRWTGQAMGSPYTIQVVDAKMDDMQVMALKAEVGQRLKDLNQQVSHYLPDSEISKFNHAPANQPFKISPDLVRLMKFSLELNRQSQGSWDPTLGPVISLWGFGEKTEKHAIPPEAELKAAMKLTGCQHLKLTDNGELIKDIPELSLNLSSSAKGFVTDEIVKLLGTHGLTNVYVAMAGDLAVRGHSPRGVKWQVGVALPMENWKENNPMATAVSLTDQAISTSGDNEKFFKDAQGRRLGHIFDPKTGWPVQHDVASVSVVGPDSMTAGATATLMFVLGQEAGLKYIEARPTMAALFIVRDGEDKFRQVPSSRWAGMTKP